MVFRVYPHVVRQVAASFGVCSEVAKVAQRYAANHGALGWHDRGVIGTITAAHEHFVGHLDARLGHLVALLAESGVELNDVAAYYEHVDTASAEALDSTYPPVSRTHLDSD